MTRTATVSRSRATTCPDCGDRMALVDCGVAEHRRTRTRAEQIAGRCPGRVYAHDTNGGIECPR